jgi:hydrogenase nickel incorporation protein HypB
MSEKTLEVGKGILDKNDRIAQRLRARYAQNGVCVLNLLSGPGAGKTSTIIATINALKDRYNVAVIEGDVASDVDALKVKEHGAAAVQINTGGLCHLEGNMIEQALDVLDLQKTDLIIIENVGNLVCTVDFDLGQTLTAMILSVPEGHDKPLKYPGIFQAADALILNKVDTLPVFDFDEAAFAAEVGDLNPTAPVFKIAATKGTGVDAWADYLARHIDAARAATEAE